MSAAVVEFVVTTVTALVAASVGGRSLVGEWRNRAIAENENAKATRENTIAIKELKDEFVRFGLTQANHGWRLDQLEERNPH